MGLAEELCGCQFFIKSMQETKLERFNCLLALLFRERLSPIKKKNSFPINPQTTCILSAISNTFDDPRYLPAFLKEQRGWKNIFVISTQSNPSVLQTGMEKWSGKPLPTYGTLLLMEPVFDFQKFIANCWCLCNPPSFTIKAREKHPRIYAVYRRTTLLVLLLKKNILNWQSISKK